MNCRKAAWHCFPMKPPPPLQAYRSLRIEKVAEPQCLPFKQSNFFNFKDVRLEGQIITRSRDPVLTLGLKKCSASDAQRDKRERTKSHAFVAEGSLLIRTTRKEERSSPWKKV